MREPVKSIAIPDEVVMRKIYLVFVFKLKLLINSGGYKHISKKFWVSCNQR